MTESQNPECLENQRIRKIATAKLSWIHCKSGTAALILQANDNPLAEAQYLLVQNLAESKVGLAVVAKPYDVLSHLD